MMILERIFEIYGVPETIISDNGPEFIAKKLKACELTPKNWTT